MKEIKRTREGLAGQGYLYKGDGECRGCSAHISWFLTKNKKLLPLDWDTLIPHFATCAQAENFRRRKESVERDS